MNNLKLARTLAHLTQAEVAKKIGINQNTYSYWENGKVNIPINMLKTLSNLFSCSIDFLIGKEKELTYIQTIPVEKRKIPYLGEIACGKPVFADEEKGVYFDVCSDLKIDFCLKAKGDSMINARIQDGDIVFIREQSMVNNGEIGAVIIGDEATLKRVYYYPEQNRLMLQAENPAYAPLFYEGTELENIHILGKAFKVGCRGAYVRR